MARKAKGNEKLSAYTKMKHKDVAFLRIWLGVKILSCGVSEFMN